MIDPELPLNVKKPPTEHPYQKCVKRIFAEKIKYSHNSIYANPVLPVKIPKRRYTGQRTKFTVIGIRSIPEFNYCVHVAQGLHRYRTYLFDPPDVQAVTCVDWPKVWTDLKVRYGGITHCVRSSVVILVNGNILGGTPEFEEYLKTRYDYYPCLDYYNLAVQSFIRFVRSSGKPHAFMHITIDDEEIGTFIFRLYSDLVPSTCDNFLRLCNTTRGGYGGTPIHRIVKDNWIQCGGYGLKNNPDLDCENFTVPHDRRGVLAMANDGRNCDCSTQFFILLQPSPWMACKYVAFGQLIDGEQTLAKIEKVPTFYESPLSKVVIAKAGILNLEAKDIVISPGTTEFIQGHIEDLVTLGAVALGWLMLRLDLEIEMIELAKLEALGEDQECLDEGAMALRNTARFMRKKDSNKRDHELPEQGPYEGANEDFDVEEYEYVYEEEVIYKQITPPGSIDARPPRPYFIPLTDVIYPGEKDSTYDLKKFLKGDYCLESDLQPNTSPRKKAIRFDPGLHHEEESLLEFKDQSPEISVHSLDSDDKNEIRRYLRNYSDHVSFAGGIITKIAKGASEYINIFEEPRQTEEQKAIKSRKVSLAVPDEDEEEEFAQHKIKRRQTGYVQLSPSDMEHATSSEMVKLALGLGRDSSDAQGRHVRVRIADADHRRSTSPIGSLMTPKQQTSGAGARAGAAQSGGPATDDRDTSDSVMKRLYDEVTRSDDAMPPTLKNYTPVTGLHEKGLLLTNSIQALRREESSKGKFQRASYTQDQSSMEQMLTLQHGKKFARKISSDYVRTIDQFEHPVLNSLRSLEYAKTRPSMSVLEYQQRNEMYKENLRRAAEKVSELKPSPVPSVKLETKLEPPKVFTAATRKQEEQSPCKIGEEERDEANFISTYRKQTERTEKVTTTNYEKITVSVDQKSIQVKTEESKTVDSFMDPPPIFITQSSTSTISKDGFDATGKDERDDISSNTSGSAK